MKLHISTFYKAVNCFAVFIYYKSVCGFMNNIDVLFSKWTPLILFFIIIIIKFVLEMQMKM